MDELLRTENLSKNFGGIAAASKINLVVNRGEIHAVIGPNGAGKTTLFNLITNHIQPTEGRVFFKGQDITYLPIYAICRKGIARSFQLINIYPELTVFESVQMSLLSQRGMAGKLFLNAGPLFAAETKRILEMVSLDEHRNLPGRLLPHGDKKRLELAITLGNRPELMLMDEPTAGMAPEERWVTVDLIKRLVHEEGITVLFSEHDMDVVFDIADKISVLNQGTIIFEGLPEEVQRNEKVRECYLGTSWAVSL